jgi:hypothetical protein
MYLDSDLTPQQLKQRSELLQTYKAYRARGMKPHWRQANIFYWDQSQKKYVQHEGQVPEPAAASSEDDAAMLSDEGTWQRAGSGQQGGRGKVKTKRQPEPTKPQHNTKQMRAKGFGPQPRQSHHAQGVMGCSTPSTSKANRHCAWHGASHRVASAN